MSKPWGAIGTWAEQAEAEEQEEAAAAASAVVEPQSFPSLREAVTSKSKKKTKMSLTEFYSSSSGGGSVGLTPDEMLRLPTGPKDRTGEEMQYGRLGGGFSNYGGRGGGPPRRDGDGRRGYGGGFDGEERRGGSSRVSEMDQPSRADEVDNWSVGKKQTPSFDMPRQQQSRYGSLGGSRADEVDNWSVGKKPAYVHSGPTRSSFGSGFRDSGPELDRWSRGNREPEYGRDRERPKLVFTPPKGDLGVDNEAGKSGNASRPNPFGAARPREEVLAEKGLDWKKIDVGIEAKKTSGTTSAHSSRPSSAQSSRSETAPGLQQGVENALRARPKVNPFGDAKPREVLLQERGQDWRKMDRELEHRAVDRPETEEEKVLKEEIDHLKEKLQKESPEGDESSLKNILSLKEKDLELLSRELDDKIKFGQKAVERPGSAAGRAPAAAYPERPPSQSGSVDGSRSMEFRDRPRSRGMQDNWSRPVDDRRGFQSGRERGFLGSRDNFDRPRSRDRW